MRKIMNRMSNAVIKPLLRSPLHSLASGSLMLITFTGRKSGRTYTTPVAYHQPDDHTVILFTQRERIWWKNLIGGAQVTLRLRGRDIQGTATALPDQPRAELEDALKAMYGKRMQGDALANFADNMLMVHIALD
jgi:deazaflavin-dependent oxidoreductase (nitroreductase family)